jgi:hypothetical protein
MQSIVRVQKRPTVMEHQEWGRPIVPCAKERIAFPSTKKPAPQWWPWWVHANVGKHGASAEVAGDAIYLSDLYWRQKWENIGNDIRQR